MENAQRSWGVFPVFPSRIPAGKGFQLLAIIEEKFHLQDSRDGGYSPVSTSDRRKWVFLPPLFFAVRQWLKSG